MDYRPIVRIDNFGDRVLITYGDGVTSERKVLSVSEYRDGKWAPVPIQASNVGNRSL